MDPTDYELSFSEDNTESQPLVAVAERNDRKGRRGNHKGTPEPSSEYSLGDRVTDVIGIVGGSYIFTEMYQHIAGLEQGSGFQSAHIAFLYSLATTIFALYTPKTDSAYKINTAKYITLAGTIITAYGVVHDNPAMVEMGAVLATIGGGYLLCYRNS